MYELMGQYKPVHVMKLPNAQDETALSNWKQEIILMKEVLEKQFDVTITDDDIRAAISLKNEERKALKELYELEKLDPPPISGMDLFNVMVGASFDFDRQALPAKIRAVTQKITSQEQTAQDKKPRILITGCPMGPATAKVIKSIEDNGGAVVCFENCTGLKANEDLVDETNADVFEALAHKYLNIGCSCMSPNDQRFKLLQRLIEEYRIDGVVEMTLTACHTYNVEANLVKRFVQQNDKAYTLIETDFSSSDVERINTRMAAFIEML
jgi:benzoyl-CoA reductase/2-hydroxyglutaryl-CoA dehydratase subunit BcrC/BadD/HgdB